MGDGVRPVFSGRASLASYKVEEVRGYLPKCGGGGGGGAETSPLSFCRSLHTLLSGQDPLVGGTSAKLLYVASGQSR